MKSLKVTVLIFFFGYTCVQAAGKNFSAQLEYFPVFSWSLFTSVRNDVDGITIEIIRVGEVQYSPPRNYYEMPELSPHAARRTSSPFKAAYGLVGARDDPEEFKKRLDGFNATFFNGASDVEFQIVVEKFNPVEKWKTGQVIARRVVIGNLLKE